MRQKEGRTIGLFTKVSPEEKEVIDKKMALLGTSNLRGYLRKMAVDGYIVQLDMESVLELVKLLRMISSNVNQIARCHNPVLPTIALEFWGLPMAFADHSPTNPRKTLQARLTDFQTRYQRTKCYK